MANVNDKNNIKDERIEDVTQYGEFISSFDQWITPDRQRMVGRHLEEVMNELAPEMKGKNKRDKKRSNWLTATTHPLTPSLCDAKRGGINNTKYNVKPKKLAICVIFL